MIRKISPLLVLLFIGCTTPPQDTRIAFSSCGHEDASQPILSLAAAYKPDLFIFLGDNIYGDTDNMDTLRAKYQRLAAKPEYQALESATRILATWDDHDFGRNDAGKHYPFKAQSKEIFLEHFKEPANSTRRQHPGVYHTEYLKQGDRVVQILLLDVRTFRSDLLPYDKSAKLPRDHYFYTLDYKPQVSPDSTLLGAEQWSWLEAELKKPADIRLVCSGSQFGIEFNGYEAWANFPHEQQRMLDLIRTTQANGVFFLTGDVHYGEISRIENPGSYPIYDITASGITSTWDFPTPNKNRIEGPVMDNHFGLLTIRWEKEPVVKMEIIDKTNNVRVEYTVQRSGFIVQRRTKNRQLTLNSEH
jgi:alkaline phosphatase D